MWVSSYSFLGHPFILHYNPTLIRFKVRWLEHFSSFEVLLIRLQSPLCKARILKILGFFLIIFGTPGWIFFYVQYIGGVVEGIWTPSTSLECNKNLQNEHDLPSKNGKFSLNMVFFGIFWTPFFSKGAHQIFLVLMIFC